MGRPGSGSISSIYTVLAEHENGNDPIVEVARATLDGQIMLSRSLADVSHYPAIDMNGSISRLAQKVISPEDLELASTYRRLWSIYEQNRDILSVGAYKAGSDHDLDTAIELRGQMVEFAQQNMSDVTDLSASMRQLRQAISSQ
jgi:flagellum-specific ATP synthase